MKRVLSILLALTLLMGVVALASCGGIGGSSTTAPTFTKGTGTEAVTTAGALSPDDPNAGKEVRKGFEDVNFGGKTFKFSGPIDATDGWADYEVYAEEGAEGILDASIIERNDILFDLYECFIEIEATSEGTLDNDFATNQNRIDILNGKYNIGSKHTNYYNFYDLDIDLEQPWWDQGIIRDLTVDGKLFAVTGAYSLTSFDATWVMFFNKTVLENNDMLAGVDPYELVRNNEWTLDKFYEIVKKAGNDDGDQVMTEGTGDIFGLVSSSFGIRGLYFGADQGYVTKTTAKDGTSEFTHALTDAAVAATNKVIDIYSHQNTKLLGYTVVQSQMRGGLTLFAPEVLRMASYYAGKQGESTDPVDIGIVPHPKLNSDQANYKHNVDNHIIYTCVPKTCKDIEQIANFLEVYAYHSYFTVYNDYLNLYKYTYTTDTEAADMVDIILQSRSFDLGYQFGWAGIDTAYINGVTAGNNVVAELKGELGTAIVEAANAYKETLAAVK